MALISRVFLLMSAMSVSSVVNGLVLKDLCKDQVTGRASGFRLARRSSQRSVRRTLAFERNRPQPLARNAARAAPRGGGLVGFVIFFHRNRQSDVSGCAILNVAYRSQSRNIKGKSTKSHIKITPGNKSSPCSPVRCLNTTPIRAIT